MKGKITKIVIVVLVFVAMLIPAISEGIASSTLKKIKYDQIEDKMSKTSYYGFAMIYVAPSSMENIKEKKLEVKTTVESHKLVTDNKTSLTAYYMDYDKLSDEEKKEIFGDNKETTAYMFITSGELLTTVYGEKSSTDLDAYVSSYSANGMSPNLISYKTAENAAAYKKLVNSKDTVTMAVFGYDGCGHCNQFKIVYNQVATDYDVDIYYFNSSTYDKDEYDKVMDLGLTIPASCTDKGEEVKLEANNFGTPLTLFTKNGKVIDCISGYTGKTALITKLKTVGMIKDED